MLLLQAIIDGCQAVDDFRDGEQVAVVGEFVLLKGVLGDTEIQQVHCRKGKFRTKPGERGE